MTVWQLWRNSCTSHRWDANSQQLSDHFLGRNVEIRGIPCQVNWNTAYMRVWTSFSDRIVETNGRRGSMGWSKTEAKVVWGALIWALWKCLLSKSSALLWQCRSWMPHTGDVSEGWSRIFYSVRYTIYNNIADRRWWTCFWFRFLTWYHCLR